LHEEQQTGGHLKHAHSHKGISVSVKPGMHIHKVFYTHAQHSTCLWLCPVLAWLSVPQLLTNAIKMELTHLGLCLLVFLRAHSWNKVPVSLERISAYPFQSPSRNGKGEKEKEKKKRKKTPQFTLMIRFG